MKLRASINLIIQAYPFSKTIAEWDQDGEKVRLCPSLIINGTMYDLDSRVVANDLSEIVAAIDEMQTELRASLLGACALHDGAK